MINYVVFCMYDNRIPAKFRKINALNLKDAISEARKRYMCSDMLLMDMFGNQYVIRVKGLDWLSPRKNRCVTLGNRSCAGCSFKSKWGSGCFH